MPTISTFVWYSYYRDRPSTSVSGAPQSAVPNKARNIRSLSLHQFFGPNGVLAQTHPAYEFRRGQLQMAQAVEQALAEKRHLIVEAGTGTGKTLAYLLPVIRSGLRVIVSTGTKTLQEQLFHKDVPFLEQVMSGNVSGTDAPKLRVCYMKGRNNYLCRKKLYELTDRPVLNGLEEIDQFRMIKEWEAKTGTGDRAELSGLAESSVLWPKLDARIEACTGSKCKEYERCFVTEMRRRAAESDIIIVNHHLFFADLAIKRSSDGAPDAGVLPDAAAVIFDEAHELEDVAASFFGISVSNLRIADLARDVEFALRDSRLVSATLEQTIQALRQRSQLFFSLLPQGETRFAFETRREFLEENGDEFLNLQNTLARLNTELLAVPNKPDEFFNLARRAEELRVQLTFVLESNDKNTVYWIERRGEARRAQRSQQNVFLQATPIDVSQILRHTLFSELDTAVLTSATLAVGGGFHYATGRLGLQHARELVVPSHFDYESQAIFYVPPDLPDPREPDFARKATDRIRRLLEITRGRAFCLFTSYAQMNDVHDRLLGELEYPMLKQGDAPKNALLEEFRQTPNAVLFATSSFWQGVDVQGEQLSCVIIDRLPFAVPNDPVVAARIKAIDDEGGNAFFDYQVPAAVISLKQGFGRLIRSLYDRGLVCLLDNRILKKQYGRVFVESLPPYRRTTDLRAVEQFFGVNTE